MPLEIWGKSRMRMREQTQFVTFLEDAKEPRPKFFNNFRIRPQGIKNADKRTAILMEPIFEEALMKTFAIARNSNNEVPVRELVPATKPVSVAKEVIPVEMQPTFTL